MYQDIFPASDPRRQEYGKVILSVLQLLVTKDLWPLVHVATKFACTYALKHTHIFYWYELEIISLSWTLSLTSSVPNFLLGLLLFDTNLLL